jgi:glyoxylase-like metal-dependent hydrolase (beta-lactamase superfamily II)
VDTYEIFALHYASLMRPAAENFLFRDAALAGDAHDLPMPLEYFVWVVRNEHRTILVDTGFDHPAGARRGRTLLRHPVEMLRGMGIDPASIADVVITHLHYDHAGNLGAFPNASFHLQDAEMAFATGRCMCHPGLRAPFEVEDVVTMVRRVYDERVRFHDGDVELFPGLSLHKVPGHSAGLQCVRVRTKRGRVVLASDASHFYANMKRRNPFPIVVDIGAMMESWGRLRALADSDDHIIPGHDGLVLELYPRVMIGSLEVVRLDCAPEAKQPL